MNSNNNGCPIELQKEHIQDIATLKSEVHTLKDKMELLDSINNAITRMTVLMEVNVKNNEDRDIMFTKQNETLERLSLASSQQNATLIKLNEKIDSTNDNVEDLRCQFDTEVNKYTINYVVESKNFLFQNWYKIIIFMVGIYEGLKVAKVIK